MEKSDQQLIEDFLAGSEPAFGILVERHLQPLFNFLVQMTHDAAAAEDLIQETFVKVWKNIRRYDHEKKFKTWLFTIAKNTAFDFFKKKKTIPFSDFTDEEGYNQLENLSDEQILPDELLEKAQAEESFEKTLTELPEIYRLILELRYKEDFSLGEIAEILKIPYNTAKSRHQRALSALASILKAKS